jgi:quercetin dioxygenase-like cupin family protein
MVIIRQGTLDVMISGKHTSAGPGSVVYFASGEEHGFKNAGADNAMYYVVALGKD